MSKTVKEINILIAGVGGQGIILMSELLGSAAINDGLSVRGSEVLGMAVRGGSVVSTVRMGSEVYGPLIPMGKGNILVGIEPAEALRYLAFLSRSSLVILNTRQVIPFTVTLGESEYPDLALIVSKLGQVSGKVITLDASKSAEEAGSPLATNMVMLGALFATGEVPIKIETIKETIQARFSARLAALNLKAFDLGYQRCGEALK